MEEVIDFNNVQPPSVGLQKVQAVIEENFDNYLIVVMNKDGMTWRAYKNRTMAFGMASMITHEINQDWWQQRKEQ